MLSPLLDTPLIAGWLPTLITILGALAGAFLLFRRSRLWWLRHVPIALVVGAGVAAVVAVLVAWLRPFPEPLPVRVLLWIALAASAVAVAVLRWRGHGGWPRRVAVGLALVFVVATALAQTNSYYGYRPTLAAALGLPPANQIDFAALPRTEPLVVAPPKQPLASTWHSPPGMPRTGRISAVTQNLRSAREAWT